MGKVVTNTRTVKMADDINKKRRDLDKAELLVRCDCTHTKEVKGSDGMRDYTMVKDGADPQKVSCYQCKSKLNLADSSYETLEQNIRSVVNILDVAKAQISMGGSQDDLRLIEKISAFQFNAQTVILDSYKALTKKNKQNKSKRQSDNSGGNTSWGASR